MRRRKFLTLFGSTVLWPLAARAQQNTIPVVGYLGLETPELYASRLKAFREGLAKSGFEEDRDVTIDYRWAEGHYERVPSLVADFVARKVDVIAVPGGVPGAIAAKAATSTIPVVFEMGGDPVALGLVASLSHPGGNLTGATSLSAEVNPKRVQVLHELIPSAKLFGFMVNPTSPANAEASTKLAVAAAEALGLKLHILEASKEADFEAVFTALASLHASGLVISNDTFYVTRQDILGAAALRHAMPAISQSREFVAAGGLMSYSGSYKETHRQAGIYVGRILKGDKPADLPVVRSTEVELFINLKTAKALGINVPLSLLGRADEVIE